MSNNRDLLKEAIADAKSVKETAIANAKSALEEAFTPHLKSMLSAKLEEMDRDDEDIDETITNEVEELEEVEEVNETEEVEEAKKEEIEEINLDELLAELEGSKEKEEVKESEEIEETEEVTEEEEVEDVEIEDEEAEGEMEEEEVDLEDMTEDDLKSFIEDVIKDMVETGELEAGDEFEAEGEEAEGEEEIEVEDETEEIMEGDEEIIKEFDLGMTDAEFIASMLGSLALVGGVAVSAAKKELEAAAKKGKEAVASTMKKLLGASEMAEAEEMTNEVESLKDEINEVNLLNAKLLYLNKIFRAKNLTENQKAKIIPAFDKAATVKEAKLIFETISENFSDSKKSIKENRSLASKPVGVAPKRELIVEVDSQVARWQKLAGIK